MKELRVLDFRRHFIGFGQVGYRLAFLQIARGGIACLNHEAVDDAMEEHTIVIALAHQSQEVVAMLRCLIVEHDAYASLVREELHLVAVVLRIGRRHERHEE